MANLLSLGAHSRVGTNLFLCITQLLLHLLLWSGLSGDSWPVPLAQLDQT